MEKDNYSGIFESMFFLQIFLLRLFIEEIFQRGISDVSLSRLARK